MGSSDLEARLAREHQHSPRQRINKGTLERFAVISLLAAGLGCFIAVSAQTLNDYEQRLVFEFEQCANACQIELDKSVFACGPFREDKAQAAPEGCHDSSYKEYDRCMSSCPLDPRPQQ